jgi:hypothetical protein
MPVVSIEENSSDHFDVDKINLKDKENIDDDRSSINEEDYHELSELSS